MPSSKLIDLGKTYGMDMPMSAGKGAKEKKHYPSVSINPDDFGDLPTDGSKFYAVICGRVSSYSNPSDGPANMSIEVRDMAQISDAEAKKLVGASASEDETTSSKRMPNFRETMADLASKKENATSEDEEGDDEY